MVLLNGLAAIISLATIAGCSPLDSDASSGVGGIAPAVGLPAIPAVAHHDHALGSGNLPHMPADLATGQLAPHSQKSENHNGQVAIEKPGSHEAIKAGNNIHSHVKHQHLDIEKNQRKPLATEEKGLTPASAPASKLALREVIERGIANIGARSDPPAQSFIQALGNMFSGLGKDKSKRDGPPALPAPSGPAPGAVNASILLNNANPAVGLPHPSQDHLPTPPTPPMPAPIPAEAALSPPASPPPAGSPSTDSNSAQADLVAASPPIAGSPPTAKPPALPATAADIAAPPAAQALPADNPNSPANPSADSPAVDTGASSSFLDLTPPHNFEPVPASPGVVAEYGHMGQFGPLNEVLGVQGNRAHRYGVNIQGAQSVEPNLRVGRSFSRQHTNQHMRRHPSISRYGAHSPATNNRLPRDVVTDFHASLITSPLDGASMPRAGQQVAFQRHYYRNRRGVNFTPLPRTRRSLHALNSVYYRRGESSASAGAFDGSAENNASASGTAGDDKPVKPDETTKSAPAARADSADSNGVPESIAKPDTETAGMMVDSKNTDKAEVNTADKVNEPEANEKSKTGTTDGLADNEPASKSEVFKPSTKSNGAAKLGKNMGSMPAGLDSSLAMGDAKDAMLKKHHPHAPKAHNKANHGIGDVSRSRKPSAKTPVYKPRPKGQRMKAKSRRPSISDHHSSHFNPHHKMIPQIARRHDLQVRNAAAEADAWADAHANYLDERDIYLEYLAKREAYAYPEAWACSDPSGCN
ncbi:hypothetical protein MMC26_007690 [Xylographa opegraphella]|nr:hypothetical protein [Xylographa opegraphella]